MVLGWRQAWRYSGKGLLAEEPSFSSASSLSGEAAPSLSVLKWGKGGINHMTQRFLERGLILT